MEDPQESVKQRPQTVKEGSQRLNNRQKGNKTALNKFQHHPGLTQAEKTWLQNESNKGKIMKALDDAYSSATETHVTPAISDKRIEIEHSLASAKREGKYPVSGWTTRLREGGPIRYQDRKDVKVKMMSDL